MTEYECPSILPIDLEIDYELEKKAFKDIFRVGEIRNQNLLNFIEEWHKK